MIMGISNVGTNIINIGGIQDAFSVAPDQIRFFIGASYNATTDVEVMRLTSTSNVLINTTTDAGFRLDVNGTARVQGNLTTNLTAGSVPFIGASGLLSQDNSTLFWDNTNKRLGIGTNAPSTLLHINTTSTSSVVSALRLNNPNSSLNSGSALDFYSGAGPMARIYTLAKNTGRGNLLFQVSNDVAGTFFDALTIIHTSGNVLIGTTTDAGFRLDVQGSTRFNGLSTIQGTTASDTPPLGSELATTGTGTNWAGTNFATGYTHTIGSTDALTTTLAAVSGTYYQITYTVTGRTTGSFVINYGGTSTFALTSTGAVGPRATSTATLEIVPTTDFNGTIVLSVRTIGTSSANVTLNTSGGITTNEIRVIPINTTFFMGLNAGRRNTTAISTTFVGSNAGANNTTGANGTFVGRGAGQNNSTGTSNTFVGVEAGFVNTIGNSNSFFGVASGAANTTGGNNAFFGVSSGASNTTGGNNSFFGLNSGNANTTGTRNSFFGRDSGLNNTTGENNIFLGLESGRRIAAGGNLTISNTSIFIGVDTRAAADNQANQIAIGHASVGLGSNTTVLGNTSTTFGRWYGSLLLGTTTNAASSILTMESTTQGVLFPRMTTTQKNAIASPATGLVVYDNTLNKLSVFTGLVWENVTSL
jgi:hypothetical protein